MTKKMNLAFPQLGFVIVTRVALGIGIGLLLADRFSRSRRRRVGLTLLSVGALTTIPAILILKRARGAAGLAAA